MSIEHRSFALMIAAARRKGLRTPADFTRHPCRIGGVWRCEVRHG